MTGEVVIFDTQIGAVSGRVKVERDPYDLVISADGANLYCSNWGSDSLSVIDLNTNTLLRTVAAGDNPNDMTLLPDGRLFVCSSNDNSVLCFDTAQMRFTEKVVTSLHHEAGRATAHVVARGKDERIDCLAFATRKSSRSHGSHEKPRGNSLKSSH
jgi:YVTN family beta-propeller protein